MLREAQASALSAILPWGHWLPAQGKTIVDELLVTSQAYHLQEVLVVCHVPLTEDGLLSLAILTFELRLCLWDSHL
jgi:hypothetical protein